MGAIHPNNVIGDGAVGVSLLAQAHASYVDLAS
jgi:hypothetical protein